MHKKHFLKLYEILKVVYVRYEGREDTLGCYNNSPQSLYNAFLFDGSTTLGTAIGF